MKRFIFMLLATLTLNVAYCVAKKAPPALLPESGAVTGMYCSYDCSYDFNYGMVPEYRFGVYTVDVNTSFPITQGCHYAVFDCDYSLFTWQNSGTELIPYSLYRAESLEEYIISYQSRIFPKPAYAHKYIKFSHRAKG